MCLVICNKMCYTCKSAVSIQNRKKGRGLTAAESRKTMTIQDEIQILKQKKDAVILAHYYVRPEVQEIADYIGDSFYLSKVAEKLPNRTIVFCGVSFMGESGALLSPDKKVLMPDKDADCPMAHMVTKEEVEEARRTYDNLAVVCYINSTAEIKSWSDVCVTSANAVKIVKNLPNHNILFIPDKNLGRYVAEQVPEKNVILVKGFCPVHEKMPAEEIVSLKKAYPKADVLAHPECGEEVLKLADYIGSTTGIIRFASESSKQDLIIATETGVLHELQKKNPEKRFHFPKTEPVCLDMKKITLEKVLHVLQTEENGAQVSNDLADAAKRPLQRMLELAE